MTREITLLIADDHEMVRMGIRQTINFHPHIKVIGEACNGREAVELARELHPDVVLLDITMPEINGIQACSLIMAARPATRVVIFSMYEKEAYARQVVAQGACGFITKTSSSAEIIDAVEKAAAGQYCFSPEIGTKIIDKYLSPNQSENKGHDGYDLLSEREQQIFRMVVEGLSSRTIGEMLHISYRTVDKHRANIIRKTGASDTLELIRYALKIGVLDPELWSSQ